MQLDKAKLALVNTVANKVLLDFIERLTPNMLYEAGLKPIAYSMGGGEDFLILVRRDDDIKVAEFRTRVIPVGFYDSGNPILAVKAEVCFLLDSFPTFLCPPWTQDINR